MKRLMFLTLLMLMSTVSFAEAETVYSISEDQLEAAIADGKLTFEEFGLEDLLKETSGSVHSGRFNFTLPKDLHTYADLSRKVSVKTLPDKYDIEINGQDIPHLTSLFSPSLLRLGEINTLRYSAYYSTTVGKDSYFKFKPLIKLEPLFPSALILNDEVTIQVKATNIGKIIADDVWITVDSKNAEASTDPIKQLLNPGESYTYEVKLTPTTVGEVNLGSVRVHQGRVVITDDPSFELGIHTVSEASSRIDYYLRPTKSYFEAGETPTFEVNFMNLGPYPIKDMRLKLWRSTDIDSWSLGSLLYADEVVNKEISMSALRDVEGRTRFMAKLSYTTDQQLNPSEIESVIWVDAVGDRIQATVEGQTAVEEGPAAEAPAKEEKTEDKAPTEPQAPAEADEEKAPAPAGGSNTLLYLVILALAAGLGYMFMQQKKLMKKLEK